MSKNNVTTNGVTVNNGENVTTEVKGFSVSTLELIEKKFPSLKVSKTMDIVSQLVSKTNFNSMTKNKKQMLGYYYILDKKYSLTIAKHNEKISTFKSENGWSDEDNNWNEPTEELANELSKLELAKHEDTIAINNAMKSSLKELNIKTYNRYVAYINSLISEKDITVVKKAYTIDMAELFISLGLQPSLKDIDKCIRAIGGEKKRLSAKNDKKYGAMNVDNYISTLTSYLVEIMIDRGLIDVIKWTKDETFLTKITDEKVEQVATRVQELFSEISVEELQASK